MSAIIDLNDDPWAMSTDLINPRRRLTMHGDVQMMEPVTPMNSSPISQKILDDCARAGREWAESFYRKWPNARSEPE